MSDENAAQGVKTGTFTVTVDGESYQVTVAPADETMVAEATASAPIPAEPKPEAPKPAAQPAKQSVPAVAKCEVSASSAATGEGQCVIEAPMPGTILSVKKRAGDAVAIGETVVVLEAMKMENDINAPCNGTIAEICCNVGDNVQRGARLLIIG